MAPAENPTGSVIRTHLRGQRLLTDAVLSKGTAFSDSERSALGLHGLLPPVVETLDQQCARAYEAYRLKDNDLERHIYLRALQDTNETLCLALLSRHIEEMTPIVYTPTVAQGCINFSRIYRRPRGLFISYPLRDRIVELLDSRPYREVDVIVVTDGERILGIGDQGAGGMGIPIGKLQLYSLIGGVEPSRTLPVLLDVGTNNPDRLRAPDYIGWKHERIGGEEYWDFVEAFVSAVERTLPHVLLQWEDFARPHARPLLEKYRSRLCTFNDDIQGTAAVVVGALHGALQVTGEGLAEQNVVIVGAGSAGTGLAEHLLLAMVREGLSEAEARRRFFLLDLYGLLHTGMANLSPIQQKFAQPREAVADWGTGPDGQIGLLDVLRRGRATVLVGVSAQPGAFTEAAVRMMGSKVSRPIIFPLSNPTERQEAAPGDLLRWTDGKALVASGSPCPPVRLAGRTIAVAQCNNLYIFPAVGLGVTASRASRVTDGMMLAAAEALGELSPAGTDSSAPLLPPLEALPSLAQHVATAVAVEAVRAGVAPAATEADIRRNVQAATWAPEYVSILPAS
ncbi:MAG: NAD-dependent malic enzyme [Myxococcaceae bacterium]